MIENFQGMEYELEGFPTTSHGPEIIDVELTDEEYENNEGNLESSSFDSEGLYDKNKNCETTEGLLGEIRVKAGFEFQNVELPNEIENRKENGVMCWKFTVYLLSFFLLLTASGMALIFMQKEQEISRLEKLLENEQERTKGSCFINFQSFGCDFQI